MDAYNNEFVQENEELLSKLTTSMMNAMDAQYRSVHNIYESISLASPLLKKFIELLKQNDATKLNVGKVIFLKVLENSIKKMNEADQELDKSSEYFNEAAETIKLLIARLGDKVKNLEETMDGLISRPGMLGAVITSGKRIDELKAKVEPIQKIHEGWKENMNNALADNEETKTIGKERIQSISDLKSKVKTEDANVFLDPDVQKSTIEHIESLLTEFQLFQTWFDQLQA